VFKLLASTENLPYKEWLECRRQGIGGSDASVLCGVNRYKSPVSVKYEMNLCECQVFCYNGGCVVKSSNQMIAGEEIMGTTIACLCCGQPFEPTCHISRQKYCSSECRVKYNNAKRYFGGEMDTCPECGDHVEQIGEKGRRRRFCTDRCRVLYHQKKQQERRQNKERPAQICPNCGIEFQPEWGYGTQRRFCSDHCRLEWWREYHKAHPKEAPAERNCAACGESFTADRWHGGAYCSRNCYLRFMEKTHVKIICAWCSEEFSALESSSRKYCGVDCAAAARHKPTEQVIHEIPESERACPDCGNQMHACSHDIFRRELTCVPAQYIVTEHMQTVYSCRTCERTSDHVPMKKSQVPAAMIPGSGIASPSLATRFFTRMKPHFKCCMRMAERPVRKAMYGFTAHPATQSGP